MEYLVLIYRDETQAPEYGTAAWQQMMDGFLRLNQTMIDSGHFVAGAGLQDSGTATSVRLANGVSTVTDGPYAETKEQLGGYYLVRAETLDEVLSLVKGMPIEALVEVRPVSFRPDAG